MAATNSTTNLGLPQWEATDKPERTDFNTAMSDIDNTVAAHLAESVHIGKNPSCKLSRNTDFSLTNAVLTPLPLNVVIINRDEMFDSTNNRVKITTAGIYLVTANVTFAGNGIGTRYIFVRVNGSAVQLRNIESANGFTANMARTVSGIMSLTVGDYVELLVFQDSGGALDIITQSKHQPNISVVRVG